MDNTFTIDGTETWPRPGFGAMGLSAWYGPTNEDQSKATLRKAIEIGCTVWNTADVYGNGHNEKIIGQVLREGDNRKRVFLITKFGILFDENPTEGGPAPGRRGISGTPDYAIEAIDKSIKRLGGIYPDAWILHRIDKATPIEETVRAMDAIRKEGKCKYIGLSECSAETLRRAAKVAKISFVEIEYSPWTTDMEQNGVLEACKELGIVVLAYSPLGRGFLTGRFKGPEDLTEGDFRSTLPRLQKDVWAQNYRIVEELEAIAKEKGCTSGQLSLSWLMHQGPNIVPIPGTKSEKWLVENFESSKVELSEKDRLRIRQVVEANQAVGDRYQKEMMGTLDA
ncbi:hypothetical protein JCM10212_000525 [Sporobolomyces blumeae]